MKRIDSPRGPSARIPKTGIRLPFVNEFDGIQVLHRHQHSTATLTSLARAVANGEVPPTAGLAMAHSVLSHSSVQVSNGQLGPSASTNGETFGGGRFAVPGGNPASFGNGAFQLPGGSGRTFGNGAFNFPDNPDSTAFGGGRFSTPAEFNTGGPYGQGNIDVPLRISGGLGITRPWGSTRDEGTFGVRSPQQIQALRNALVKQAIDAYDRLPSASSKEFFDYLNWLGPGTYGPVYNDPAVVAARQAAMGRAVARYANGSTDPADKAAWEQWENKAKADWNEFVNNEKQKGNQNPPREDEKEPVVPPDVGYDPEGSYSSHTTPGVGLRPRGPGIASLPTADGDGPTGPAFWNWMPNPDGGGPMGPASRMWMPTPDGGGPMGPAARGALGWMPTPDGGGPMGPASLGAQVSPAQAANQIALIAGMLNGRVGRNG